MSIEKLIADQTAALQANTAAMAELCAMWRTLAAKATAIEQNPNTHTLAAAGVKLADMPKGDTEAKAETKTTKTTQGKATDKAAADPKATDTPAHTQGASEGASGASNANASASHSEDKPEITAALVSERTVAAARKFKADVIRILTGYGAKRGSDLKPEQWAPYLEELDALEGKAGAA